jgi:hypothetical protein
MMISPKAVYKHEYIAWEAVWWISSFNSGCHAHATAVMPLMMSSQAGPFCCAGIQQPAAAATWDKAQDCAAITQVSASSYLRIVIPAAFGPIRVLKVRAWTPFRSSIAWANSASRRGEKTDCRAGHASQGGARWHSAHGVAGMRKDGLGAGHAMCQTGESLGYQR